jgi:hypothetical protein
MALSLDGTTGISASGNITGGNVIASGALVVGSFTPSSVSTSGNVIGGNINTAGLVSATGNIIGAYLFGNASTVTGLSASKIFNGTSEANIGTSGGNANITIAGTSNVFVVASTGIYTTGLSSVTGNIQGGNILTAGLVSATGSVAAASVVGGVMTGTSISVTGAVSGASISVSGTITGANIVNGGANGVGNIGSETTYFNTVFAKATSAQYADLAEMYCADSEYTPGTVLDFGGNNEVTTTTTSHSTQVAGIVSTNPSYLMNSALDCLNAVEVALVGRVPCHVVGKIAKGDRLVSSNIPGIATRLDMSQYQPGCIIGKALEAYDSETVGTIEVAVGRI